MERASGGVACHSGHLSVYASGQPTQYGCAGGWWYQGRRIDVFAATIIMLPITGFLVAINLAVGVISRSSPQMNLFAVGFPITMIVIFVLLYMWVDALGHSLTELSQSGVDNVMAVLGMMTNG